jgi:hypothetical protein
MSNRKHVSEIQTELSIKDEVEYSNYSSPEEDELYTLLEQVLMDVFVFEEDKESLDYLTGNAIYDLADDKEILLRERYAQENLDEGCPSVDEFDELMELAEKYFNSPKHYPLGDDSESVDYVTGFIQIYSGNKFNKKGQMTEYWKSVDCKIVISVEQLLEPEKVIAAVESCGFKWSEIIRVVFYGSPLTGLIESRFYAEKESKELVPIENNYQNILLAAPDYCESELESESTFDWMDRELQEGILYGVMPNAGRVVTGHWEMTWARLDELAEEEIEQTVLLQISRRERSSVAKKNHFFEKYLEARSLITGLNSGLLSIGMIYNKDISVLEDVIHLSTKLNERVSNPAAFLQIKALVIKSKVQKHQESESFALSVIQKINNGDFVEIHLIPLTELEKVFTILWGNLGIKIIPSKKEVYHQLKSRLLQLRKAKSRLSG